MDTIGFGLVEAYFITIPKLIFLIANYIISCHVYIGGQVLTNVFVLQANL